MSESTPRIRRTSPAKLAYWREHVAAWHRSGLGQSVYCRQEGISKSSLGLWIRRLAREQGDAPALPVIVAVAPEQFAPVMSDMCPELAPLRLHVGGRFRVDVTGDFAAPVLLKLLRTLERLA